MDKTQEKIMELVQQAAPMDPIHYVDYAVEGLAMEALNSGIKSCNACEECHEGPRSIISGNPHGAILVVGEYILESQFRENVPEVKPFDRTAEGNLLLETFEELGVNQKQLIFMNVVNCFTHAKVGNEICKRAPKTSEISNCQCFVDYAINSFKPLSILVLGNIALNVFKKGVIAKDRGTWFNIRERIPSLATYSPTTVLQIKDEELKEMYTSGFKADIKEFFDRIMEAFPDSDIVLNKEEN